MSTEFFSDRFLDFLSNEDNKVDISNSRETTVDALIADIPDSVLDLGGDGVVPIVERELDGRPAAVSSEFKWATTVELERPIAKNDLLLRTTMKTPSARLTRGSGAITNGQQSEECQLT